MTNPEREEGYGLIAENITYDLLGPPPEGYDLALRCLWRASQYVYEKQGEGGGDLFLIAGETSHSGGKIPLLGVQNIETWAEAEAIEKIMDEFWNLSFQIAESFTEGPTWEELLKRGVMAVPKPW